MGEWGTMRCPQCGGGIATGHLFCGSCGAALATSEPTTAQAPAVASHSFRAKFPVPVAVACSVLTANAFFVFNYALKQGRLPKLAANDPSGGKALGLLFVPVFNLYWACFVWWRLAKRINLQFESRGLPHPIQRIFPALVGATFVATVIGASVDPRLGASIWLANWLFFVPVLTAQLQSAINTLVETP